MGSYRSAYEDYYKNINNTAKGRREKKNYSILDKKNNNSISPRYGSNMRNNDKIVDILIKRITKELTGAIILLLFFVGLKYIPSAQAQDMHIKCKQILEQSFNYSEYIEDFNAMQLGNIKGSDLKIGNFTTKDLTIGALKERTFNFMEYLKNGSKLEN